MLECYKWDVSLGSGRALTECSPNHFFVILTVCLGLLSRWSPGARYHIGCLCTLLHYFSPQYNAALTMLHCSDARLWALAGLLQMWHLAFKQKNVNLCFITPENFVSRSLRGFQVSFAHPLQMLSIQSGFLCQTCGWLSYAFYWGLATIPNKPDWWIDWSLILPWFLRLPRLPRKSPGGCKCLPFADHGGQRGHYWDPQCSRSFPPDLFLSAFLSLRSKEHSLDLMAGFVL